jgi:hypothetical protein
MIRIAIDRESNIVTATNENNFPVRVDYAQYGFPEHGVYTLEAGEYLSLDSSNMEERPVGYQRARKPKYRCEVSPPPAVRRFRAALENGAVDVTSNR